METFDAMDKSARRDLQRAIVAADGPTSQTLVWSTQRLSAARLEAVADSDVRFVRHAKVLTYYRKAETGINQKGDLAEVIAHEQIVEQYGDAGTVLPRGRARGIKVEFKKRIDGKDEQEWDHLVLGPDGEVRYLFETKSATGNVDDAEEQLSVAQKLDGNEFTKISPRRPPVNQLSTDDFDLSDSELVTVGPKGNSGSSSYDESLPFTAEELSVTCESIKQLQSKA